MGSDELHQNTAECVRHMDDQPILVSAEIEDDAIVADEINSRSELSFDIRRTAPLGLLRCGEPQADRLFSLRMTLPKLLERSPGDHLHSALSIMSPKRLQGAD
jgi:hypothetical protein